VETEYVEIKHDFDKSHEISIQNTVPRHETENSARIYPNPNDPLCPYKVLKFYRTLCPPHQDRVFCMLASPSQCKQHADNGHAYIYNPKRPVGVNKIDNTVLAKRMGFENPDRCTAHGNRKLGITTVVTNAPKDCNKVILEASRHKSIQTSLTYQKLMRTTWNLTRRQFAENMYYHLMIMVMQRGDIRQQNQLPLPVP